MLIYSKKIIKFINEIKIFAKKCLSEEIGLKVYRDRFYDKGELTSYPLNIVIFNNKSKLGYFDSDFYEIGLHECLMHTNRAQLYNIIRHEIAHYIIFVNFGPYVQPHGVAYRSFCQDIGWGEEVYSATTCLDDNISPVGILENSALRKVQKLMALSTSANENESEQAIIKAQQLLLKHNIESKYTEDENEENICLKRIMKQKKENAKMRAIASILKTFFVNPVFNRMSNYIHLEIVGTAVNIEIAEYVAAVLDFDLDRLWGLAQKQHAHLKGMVAKNSFFYGIAKGYCNKIELLQKSYQSDLANSLMVIEKKLIDATDMVYPRLSSGKSGGSYCQESSLLGQQAGRQLNINPALSKASKNSEEFLAYMI
jgi:hypothetical protein